MAWEHFEILDSGCCRIFNAQTASDISAVYEIGRLTTGRSRVFWGDQIIVYIEQTSFIGRSKGDFGSYHPALMDLNEKLAAKDLRLMVAGNHPSYIESPMSGLSGYGYIEKGGSCKIMSFYDLGKIIN